MSFAQAKFIDPAYIASRALMSIGEVVSIEVDWYPFFAVLPRKTISGKRVWFKKIYARRVWVYNGFSDEPETQYGELFDILCQTNSP